MISCLVLTHADLGSGLKNAVEGMMGKQEAFSVISNTGRGKEELIETLRKEVEQNKGYDGVVIFVDMFGSSCWYTAKKVASGIRDGLNFKSTKPLGIAIITGVNLPMLVKFFSSRDTLSFNRLVTSIRQEGEKGIVAEN